MKKFKPQKPSDDEKHISCSFSLKCPEKILHGDFVAEGNLTAVQTCEMYKLSLFLYAASSPRHVKVEVNAVSFSSALRAF